jgi:hypothetical protein
VSADAAEIQIINWVQYGDRIKHKHVPPDVAQCIDGHPTVVEEREAELRKRDELRKREAELRRREAEREAELLADRGIITLNHFNIHRNDAITFVSESFVRVIDAVIERIKKEDWESRIKDWESRIKDWESFLEYVTDKVSGVTRTQYPAFVNLTHHHEYDVNGTKTRLLARQHMVTEFVTQFERSLKLDAKENHPVTAIIAAPRQGKSILLDLLRNALLEKNCFAVTLTYNSRSPFDEKLERDAHQIPQFLWARAIFSIPPWATFRRYLGPPYRLVPLSRFCRTNTCETSKKYVSLHMTRNLLRFSPTSFQGRCCSAR